MTTPDSVAAYCGAFVDELFRSGVRHVVISPGSRSTPLALVFADHPHVKVWLQVDERSAGFFALGMAKAHRQPVALLCTSGTAAANYFPAIVEASLSRVPLVVLTSDRPHELRDVGASQAIDQIKLYGTHVKWFQEMALPEASPAILRYARTTAGRAVAEAISGPCGPVHLNFPFREPLIPDLRSSYSWVDGRSEAQPYVKVSGGRRTLDEQSLERLAGELRGVERGLIVCGPQDDMQFPEAVVALAEQLQFPILADPLSQMRRGAHDKTLVIDGYDAFLRDARVVSRYVPDVVIRFGAMPVSKPFMLYMKKHETCRQIVVDGDGGWREPSLCASDIVYADDIQFCRSLAESVGRIGKIDQSSWASDWIELNCLTQRVVKAEGMSDALFEGRVFLELQRRLPSDAIVFAGNSMPVRDLDTFFMNDDVSVRTMANRGASGIDGVVSSALGASTTGSPLVLVVGDLSFYHDLNGLLAAKLQRLDATIVLVNNDGGGIFSFLPQAEHPKHFETLFGTPLGLDYRHAVEMYGGAYVRVDGWPTFCEAVDTSIRSKGLTVIEVPTDRADNAARHRAVWQAVSHALDPVLKRRGESPCASR